MRRAIGFVLLVGAILLSNCTVTPPSTQPPGQTPLPAETRRPPTSTAGPPQPVELRPGGFAAYVPVPVDVDPQAPAYVPDLDAVTNADLLSRLGPAQQAVLETAGFVIVPQGYEQIYTLYKQAEEQGIPAFVTTDAVLHAYHILYDYALRMAEMDYFIADLEALSAALLAAAEDDYAAASGVVQEAAYQNLAYFAVAHKLLLPDAKVPKAVRDVVAQELKLIDAHSGFVKSPIFGYLEDYSQYVPRGHYTRNEDFERYFRAMMWYGRIAFYLVGPDSAEAPRDPEASHRETRGALLIVRALNTVQLGDEAALDVWERIYEPTAFFVGTADDLTVYEYATAAQKVYGGLPAPAALADEAQLEAFMEVAKELRPPQIVGGFVTDQQEAEVALQGFRLMGQRFIPDSYMFQQLVYDKVKGYLGDGEPFTMSPSAVGPIRGFPRGLDIPAVLNSARALQILTDAGDTEYDGYAEQLAKLQAEFAALPATQWTENLYWNWLHSLMPLLAVKGAGYPVFMQSTTWIDKDLHTWLGSWTELRHDTILYAKQSYTVFAESAMIEPEPQLPQGYVEPQPEVYARLASLTSQMRTGLGERGLVNDEMRWHLDGMEHLLLDLKAMSEKELRGESLSEEEYGTIRNVGATLENLTTFSAAVEKDITSEADEKMALIADVHTDSNVGLVLEEAVGNAYPIYVIVLVEGQQVIARGGTFSYYEFKQPMSDRLTDEAWQALSPKPDRPAWTRSFIVQE